MSKQKARAPFHYGRWTVEHQVIAGTIALVVLILLILGSAVLSASRSIQADNRIYQDEVVVATLNATMVGLDNEETSVRGYLLTGEPRYLAPYEYGQTEVASNLQKLKGMELLPGDPQRLARLTQLSQEKLAELKYALRLYRQRGLGVARAFVMTGQGIATMNSARDLIGAEQADYQQSLERAKRTVRQRLRNAELWGGVIALLVIVSSLAAVRQTRKNMHEAQQTLDRRDFDALHDPLTNLPNRRMFMEEMNAHLQECDVASVIFLDLDGFKAINDYLGHEGGDRLLKVIAGRLSRACRASDLVSRFGGDEFAVFVPQAGDIPTGALAQRLAVAVGEPLEGDLGRFSIAASIGVAMYPQDAQDVHHLLIASDTAMYQAKSLGKHCIVYFSQTRQHSDPVSREQGP